MNKVDNLTLYVKSLSKQYKCCHIRTGPRLSTPHVTCMSIVIDRHTHILQLMMTQIAAAWRCSYKSYKTLAHAYDVRLEFQGITERQ